MTLSTKLNGGSQNVVREFIWKKEVSKRPCVADTRLAMTLQSRPGYEGQASCPGKMLSPWAPYDKYHQGLRSRNQWKTLSKVSFK